MLYLPQFDLRFLVQAHFEALNNKVSAIITAVALNVDGTYIQPEGTNFLDASSSVMNALALLDTQTQMLSLDLGTEIENRQQAIATLTLSIQNVDNALAQETLDRQAGDTANQGAITIVAQCCA